MSTVVGCVVIIMTVVAGYSFIRELVYRPRKIRKGKIER